MNGEIKVVIVDDSASVRQILKDILSQDPSILVTAIASNPEIAMKSMEKDWPDVIISDIEMPVKDGISFTKEIMSTHPTPVVICSALTENNVKLSMEAMAAGAIEVISKPKVGMKNFLYESALTLIDSVKSAAGADVGKFKKVYTGSGLKVEPKFTADVILAPAAGRNHFIPSKKLVAIGASAGGTQTIEEILVQLPESTPGIVIVQHMPENFTKAFAERLDKLCRVRVKEAENGELIHEGKVIIAAGNRHLIVESAGDAYKVVVKEGPLVCRHRPSVDVLFRSVSKCSGKNALGIILTGMGDDGANGMLEMKNAGIRTIAQDKATCIVFGMPKMAIERGGVNTILPLGEIPKAIMSFSGEKFN
ncbi:MAG: chemotaxis response regulator protein-glutamate methylesterase [Spirochaetes bacterium]|nr:chemotaxis response regulator protein-glutamate methylesterase [Spirochaetota bacterium]